MTRPLARILVADRLPIVRRGLRLLIEDADRFRVVGEAADGREALQLTLDTSPSIVVLDFCLPKLNALELIHRVRRAGLRTEFLIHSSNFQEQLAMEALRVGVKGFIPKSGSEGHLLAALHALSDHRPFFLDELSRQLLDRILQFKPKCSAGSLTSREREVVQLVAEGRINKQVSHALNVSIKTVETHRASVMHKLGLRTTADLVRYAVRTSMIEA